MKNLRAICSIGIAGIAIAVLILFVLFWLSNNNKLESKTDDFKTDDFNKTKLDFQSGNYSLVFDIPKEYYTRMDFYPFSFDDKNKNATYGYGAYPGNVKVNIRGFTADNRFSSYTFIHSSPSVSTYQGMKLVTIHNYDDLFDIKIEPSEILLSPAPLDNWTYKINVTISSKKDIPKGEYIFKVRAEKPDKEKDVEYQNRIEKIGFKYFKYVSGSPIQPDKFFDITLKVND